MNGFHAFVYLSIGNYVWFYFELLNNYSVVMKLWYWKFVQAEYRVDWKFSLFSSSHNQTIKYIRDIISVIIFLGSLFSRFLL